MTRQEQAEARKKIAAFAFVGILVIGLSVRFGLMPLLKHIDAMVGQAEGIESQLERARRLIRDEPKTLADHEEATMTLKSIVDTYIPPSENPLSWASQHIYYVARQIDVEVQQIIPRPRPAESNIPAAQQPRFVPYRVYVQAACSYRRGIQLIRVLEKSNPFICISEVNIVSQSDDIERHKFTFVAEWPSWSEASSAQWFSML